MNAAVAVIVKYLCLFSIYNCVVLQPIYAGNVVLLDGKYEEDNFVTVNSTTEFVINFLARNVSTLLKYHRFEFYWRIEAYKYKSSFNLRRFKLN